MTPIPHDHVLRYRFESDERPDVAHVCDLGEFDGFGECSCEDFIYRLRPRLVAGEREGLRRCKHLEAAREDLLQKVISRLAAGEP